MKASHRLASALTALRAARTKVRVAKDRDVMSWELRQRLELLAIDLNISLRALVRVLDEVGKLEQSHSEERRRQRRAA